MNPEREKLVMKGWCLAGLVGWRVSRVLRGAGERRHLGSYFRCEILRRTNSRKWDSKFSLKLK